MSGASFRLPPASRRSLGYSLNDNCNIPSRVSRGIEFHLEEKNEGSYDGPVRQVLSVRVVAFSILVLACENGEKVTVDEESRRGFLHLAAGESHTCSILPEGNVACWGSNEFGTLGFRNAAASRDLLGNSVVQHCAQGFESDRPCQTEPAIVPGIKGVTTLSARLLLTCALGEKGVSCWGFGGVFDAFPGGRSSGWNGPVTMPDSVDATDIAVGGHHACGITKDRRLKCWGGNGAGPRIEGSENGAFPSLVDGLDNVIMVSLGLTHSCALVSEGSVWCWGDNEHGELGLGTVTGPEICDSGGHKAACSLLPQRVQALENVVSVSVGDYRSCAIVADGSIHCWGEAGYGHQEVLEDGTRFEKCGIDPCNSIPSRIKSVVGAVSMSVGTYHTCAALKNETVVCWGTNFDGQLGNGTRDTPPIPVGVGGLDSVEEVVVGLNHSCALLQDGKIRCWGRNDMGQLGDGTTEARTTPVPVSENTISGNPSTTWGGPADCSAEETDCFAASVTLGDQTRSFAHRLSEYEISAYKLTVSSSTGDLLATCTSVHADFETTPAPDGEVYDVSFQMVLQDQPECSAYDAITGTGEFRLGGRENSPSALLLIEKIGTGAIDARVSGGTLTIEEYSPMEGGLIIGRFHLSAPNRQMEGSFRFARPAPFS